MVDFDRDCFWADAAREKRPIYYTLKIREAVEYLSARTRAELTGFVDQGIFGAGNCSDSTEALVTSKLANQKL